MLALSGCGTPEDDDPEYSSYGAGYILTLPPTIAKAQHSLRESQLLLGQISKDCTSGSSPRATPAAFDSAESGVQSALDAIGGYYGFDQETGEMTTADGNALLDQADAALGEARALAKQCGSDEPDFPEGADWSKTWWDFSSP
ncbi:MAG: hypothetical protein H6856_03955 [Rhodospirillales bacterium]|nr:hypothetical protein [Rhodospirillales bacterium]